MKKDVKVVQKGLKGKVETPTIVFKGDDGLKLVLPVEKSQLENFEIEDLWTVTVTKEQQTLGG